MADHWVAEVFPPKFQFGSVEEMLHNPGLVETENEKFNSLDKVYRKVYFEQEKTKKLRDKELKLKHREKQDVSSVRPERQRKQEIKTQRKDEDECTWNEKELKTLRTFLQKAKMQNLQLATMLESAQDEVNVWKEKYREVAEANDVMKNRSLILKKKYERLKVNYRALKKDVRRYHTNLKVTRQDCEELKSEKSEIEETLNQKKSELHSEKFHNEHLQSRLDRKEREFEENIKRCEYFLEQQHQLGKAKLHQEIDRLNKELKIEREDNNLNKKALEHLRNHFANLQINQDDTEGIKVMDKVLSVIDIDYLPV